MKAVAVVLVVACAACAPVSGSPVASTPGPATTTPASPVPLPGVTPLSEMTLEPPEVTGRALDLAPWADDLCGLLTDPEAAAAGLDLPGEESAPDPDGGYCERLRRPDRASLTVRIRAEGEDVSSMLTRWRPGESRLGRAEVDGYPAVVWSPGNARCEVGVMVAADQSVHVDVVGLPKSCDSALTAAEYVVRRVAG